MGSSLLGTKHSIPCGPYPSTSYYLQKAVEEQLADKNRDKQDLLMQKRDLEGDTQMNYVQGPSL